ncbi:universal stress protein [Vaginella massiliensis]|uniref:universal stress protein n=1 Tax=Vaginella massiliensis TaxID=1816680 RepID=UPI000838C5D1|nr:universal stress protein [Vaginella massiliensis]
MKKILFPTDFSETANTAFLYALNLAKVYDADIDVLHATSKLKIDIEEAERTKFDDYLNYLEQLRDQENENFEIQITGHIVTGDLLITIQELSEKNDYIYIVMGTDGENSVDDKILGTTTLNVANLNTIPVLAVPNHVKFKTHKRLGFASRLLEKEYPILEKLVALAQRQNYPLEVVHITKSGILNTAEETNKNVWEKQFDEESLEITILYHKDIDEGIAQFVETKRLDILCVVHREMSNIQRLFKLNHSKRLLKTLKIPILIYPELTE